MRSEWNQTLFQKEIGQVTAEPEATEPPNTEGLRAWHNLPFINRHCQGV